MYKIPGIYSGSISSYIAWNYYSSSIYYVKCWNEYTVASVFLKKDTVQTMTIGLQKFVQQNGADWPLLMAAAAIATIPAILFVIFSQKYLLKDDSRGCKRIKKEKIMRLKVLCEYMDQPKGLNMDNPRFSWSYEDVPNNINQKNYQIVVKKENENGEIVWDSQTVAGKESTNIFYKGLLWKRQVFIVMKVTVTLDDGYILKK